MEVLYWQASVAISVAVVYFIFSRGWALAVAGGWTLWTFAALSYTPLVLIQLAVAWGTFYAIDSFTAQARELAKFKDALQNYEAESRNRFLAIGKEGRITPLRDSDHYAYLLASIGRAKYRILVLSGWLSDRVIDRKFLGELDAALKRGVSVYLGFGFEDSRGGHELSRPAKAALASLKGVQSKYGCLYVGKFNNHQKILLIDDSYVVCGSHNWLSNRSFKNRERSFVIYDADAIESTFTSLSPSILENPA